ncbi:MAG: hypothetical protein IT306_10540 [Chloroflexi bacterium]|nr:hypothetical protein [Chloroflexota bacterium]
MHADGVRGRRPGWVATVGSRPAWPDWAVALALLLVAFGLLGGVALAVERLRPPVEVQPAIVLPERLPPPVVRRGRGDPLEAELATAYQYQAATVARALRTLDEDALDGVLAGPELERRRAEVAGLREQGRAVELEARLADDVMFVEVGPLRGVVYVISSTRARYVDPATGAPIGPFSRTEDIRLSATFERAEVGAPWKLTSSKRHR